MYQGYFSISMRRKQIIRHTIKCLIHCLKVSATPNLEYCAMNHLEQTQFLPESKDMNGRISKMDSSSIGITRNGSGKSVLMEPINGTTGRRTTITLYPVTDSEMNGQVIFWTDGEGTLC
ncbi:hypothetical protein GCK32_021447 [Trichostrongylus colubriformis]|uniref:Uncharacterized protein n=1 Tax=Trichostrongylus colubriformis TaxID=6319 RepID=A0AAN8F8K2_TRICO